MHLNIVPPPKRGSEFLNPREKTAGGYGETCVCASDLAQLLDRLVLGVLGVLHSQAVLSLVDHNHYMLLHNYYNIFP